MKSNRKFVTIQGRSFKMKKEGRRLNIDRVNVAMNNANTPGFNDKFMSPRQLAMRNLRDALILQGSDLVKPQTDNA